MYQVDFDKIKKYISTNIDLRQDIYFKNTTKPLCNICLEELQENTMVTKLPCNHIYHTDCIDKWFNRNISCPTCRKEFINKFSGVYIGEHYSLTIDESKDDHYTQILFMLKESFYNKEKKYTIWKEFTKKELNNICEADKHVYIDNYDNGLQFVDQFPEKINQFINDYCLLLNPVDPPLVTCLNSSLPNNIFMQA